jgi:hypothetical protein
VSAVRAGKFPYLHRPWDKLGAFAGVSGRPVEKIAKVIATTALIVAITNRRSERRPE